jgi:hypothetical protein
MRYPPSLLIDILEVNKGTSYSWFSPGPPFVYRGSRRGGTAPLSTEQIISAMVHEYLQQPGTKFENIKVSFFIQPFPQ